MVAKVTVSEGEFAGWQMYDLHGTFDQVVGPFYFKPDPDGRMRCAFRAEPKHMNAGDRMHGGCLMTFADIAMFQTAYQEMEGASGVTVSLDSTFSRLASQVITSCSGTGSQSLARYRSSRGSPSSARPIRCASTPAQSSR